MEERGQLISGQPIKSFPEPRDTSYPIVIIKPTDEPRNAANITLFLLYSLNFGVILGLVYLRVLLISVNLQ